MNKKLEGDIGEQKACNYLKSIGYKIIDRNVYLLGGEIDIIALDNDVVVFVEVKYRATTKFGSPLESITSNKTKSLLKTIKAYIAKNHLYNQDMRIDVISILDEDIEHIKDAIWLN